MAKMKFKFLPHTADLKFQASGSTKNKLFENCALALTNAIAQDQKIKTRIKKKIAVSGKDDPALLYNFLEEILFLLDSENFVTAKTIVKISGKNLKAELKGDNAPNYFLDSVKAITYHEMYVRKIKDAWHAQVVIDV